MRKVVAVELVSQDGVMESPEEWAFSYSNDEMEEANASGMAASDALLMGRVTYEQMLAYWPNQPGGVPMVDYINSVSKYVFSTTLEEPLEWNNSTLIKGDVAEEIARLKRQREASLRGRARSASAGAPRLEDVRHGRPLSYLPAITGLKPHPSSQSGGCANYLSRGSDSEHHPFTLDLCLVRLATVLVGQFVDVLSRLLTPHLRYDFPAHFDEAIGVFHIPDRDRHPRVAFDVAKLLAVHLGVDQEVLLIGIDPHHLSLRVAAG